MARLNTERQKELEPKRVEFAKLKIEGLGFKITFICDNLITFDFKGSKVQFYPYSGWHTGKTIKDGRGIDNLLKQLIS